MIHNLTYFITQALQITMIDLVLSGDNVGVIALAIRDLPSRTARKAKIVGISGAVLLRIFFVLIISSLFSLTWLHVDLIGGLLLLYITWSMVKDDAGGEVKVKAGKSFLTAVASIILADASMSLDNVLAIASVALKQSGSSAVGPQEMGLIIFGLSVCIPVIFFGSGIVAKLMQKYPIIIYICAGILVNTAFGMILKDALVKPYTGGYGRPISLTLGIAVVVFGAVKLYAKKKLKE